jgi:hypothetical protein
MPLMVRREVRGGFVYLGRVAAGGSESELISVVKHVALLSV